MLIFEISADEAGLGKMVCQWEEDAALLTIRRLVEKFLIRKFFEEYERTTGHKGLSEAEIQETLDALSVKALALLKECAPQIFHVAQNQLVLDIFSKVTDIALSRIKLRPMSNDGKVMESSVLSLGELKGMERFKKIRKKMSETFKRIHNERIGVRRGREAGKKDAKARRKRADSAERREKILAAMREIGQAPFLRGEVARRIGVSTKTLGTWVSKEEWEFLTVEALSIGSRK